MKILITFFLTLQLAGPDECEVAADIYQCGRDVAPSITDQIFTATKGDATVVSISIFLGKFYYFLSICTNISNTCHNLLGFWLKNNKRH